MLKKKLIKYGKNSWIHNDISTFGRNQETNWELIIKGKGKKWTFTLPLQGKQIGNKEKLFFIKCLINVEEMLEYHHFAIPNEIIDAGNDYHWLKEDEELYNEWLDCLSQS